MNDRKQLSIWRNIKIGFFHLGSGMADVMTTGVWNRIMISDLGFAATPVGLLVSLRYFLAPVGIWAGRFSDRRTVGGFRRLFWIWLGRAMMVASVFILGFQTSSLARGQELSIVVWIILVIALLLFSLGSALSSSTFLALIYDRTDDRQRGRAVGIVWTFLLLGFTIGGILFGVMLPAEDAATSELSFTPDRLQTLFLVVGGILGVLWFFSLVGEEKRSREEFEIESREDGSLVDDLKQVWIDRSMRSFMFYLILSMIFAFSQDLILEPFAADVFDMDAAHTTRFAAYWGSMSILGTLMFLVLSRKYKFFTNAMMSYIGVITLVGTFALFGIASFGEIRGLITPGLVLLGLGLGFWNVGTLGLMMDMSPFGHAGTFLGFWTLIVTFSRGIGVSGGGIMRDITLGMTNDLQYAYGFVFVLGLCGLSLSLYMLSRINVSSQNTSEPNTGAILAGAID